MTVPDPNDLGLAGRKILVVGAAQGIGNATAIWLSELGARVVAADVKDCRETASVHRNMDSLRLDLTEPGTAESALAELNTAESPLYGVVNCAGLLMRQPLDALTDDAVALQTEVNQSGAFRLARASLRELSKNGVGRIVLFTSQGAFTGGYMGSIPYAMNKAAVAALVKSLARVGASSGVTVNAVSPGAADTPMLRTGMTVEDLETFKRMIPLGRFADVNEVAGPTVFLLSSWARYITGATVHVNGGQLMV